MQPEIAHQYQTCQPHNVNKNLCFEIFGYDILLDHNLKPWLLEINHTPSFSCGSPLDLRIKKGAIKDAMRLMNVSLKERNRLVKE